MDKLTLETQIDNARYHLVRIIADNDVQELERATDALNQALDRYDRYKLELKEKKE